IQTSRYPGAKHKSFSTRQEADEWLGISQFEPPQFHGSTSTSNQSTSLETNPAPEIELSPEQSRVLEKVRSGKNVFFTGSAGGTGKSVLLREIIKLRGGSASHSLGITASTGIAAVNIGGTTLHSWAGIGLGQEDVEKYVGKFFGQKKVYHVRDRWQNVKTLIIDEVSMLDGGLFDKLEEIARRMRKDSSPFGGIQLVLSGDFSQLPPVPGRPQNGVPAPTPKFSFEAKSWNRCIGQPVTLTKVFRQRDQVEFVNMLNEMRTGRVTGDALRIFQGLSAPRKYADGIEPTELYPLRYQVDTANSSRLNGLSGNAMHYVALEIRGQTSDGRPLTDGEMSKALERVMAPKSMSLKVGAQVMLVKASIFFPNRVLVNGSIGQVTRFCTTADAIKNQLAIGRVGMGSGGSGYTPPENDPAVQSLPKGRLWPVVRFINRKEVLCIPLEFTVEGPDGTLEAKRIQIPLILAWAISIHKSQGQTLERVKVDLGRVFESGQAYVALSRATSLEGLQVMNFDPTKVRAHPSVLQWYEDNDRRDAEDSMNMEDERDSF
ncbi:hypothetical protein K435DRAFT_626600, partial [Dendrothele bispora CBS 962.96]